MTITITLDDDEARAVLYMGETWASGDPHIPRKTSPVADAALAKLRAAVERPPTTADEVDIAALVERAYAERHLGNLYAYALRALDALERERAERDALVQSIQQWVAAHHAMERDRDEARRAAEEIAEANHRIEAQRQEAHARAEQAERDKRTAQQSGIEAARAIDDATDKITEANDRARAARAATEALAADVLAWTSECTDDMIQADLRRIVLSHFPAARARVLGDTEAE